MKWTRLYLVVLGLFLVGTIVYTNIDGKAKREQEATALAVDKLPIGVEVAWVGYVENQLAVAIQRREGQIQLFNPIDDIFDTKTYISLNMPYTIDCNSVLGGSVTFGSGKNSILVPIFGILTKLGTDRTTPPELGVNERSIAAKRLYQNLCPIISEYMQDITQQ